jgi:glycerol-3-phosphate dehydrogenase (NAD(P)+)
MTTRPHRRVVVIGDGGWGTTLAMLLHRNGVKTALWSAFPEHVDELKKQHENRRYLPGVKLPPELFVTADPFEAARGAELALSVVPTQFLRKVAETFEDALEGAVPVVSCTKGIEIETFRTPSEILYEVLGKRPIAVLSGPSHAEEVAIGLPASVVVASSTRTSRARPRPRSPATACGSTRTGTRRGPSSAARSRT